MAQPGPSGLSQRRRGGGGGGGATSHLDIDDPSSSRPSSPSLASPALKHRNTNPHNGASGSNSADSQPSGAGGHRIAYDPRDLPNTAEEARLPRLTLMEEVLLLGLKDRQGYLSFWNDSISYSLRGAILAELLLRKRLRVVRDAGRGRLDVQDRLVEVVEDAGGGGKKVKMTGEVLLDEALKMIKGSEEKRSVAEWIDLLSGETWNLSKIGYQLKQVRERLAKGLVDKGVLRTEKRNFLLFDMATHPIADATAKRHVVRRVTTLVCGIGAGGSTSSSSAAHLGSLYADESDEVSYASLRSLVLVCCAFAANVLDNALVHLSYEGRECAFQKVEDWLEVFGAWPMGQGVPNSGGAIGAGAAMGNAGGVNGASSYSSSAAAKAARGGGDGARIAEGSVLQDQREDAFGLGAGSSSSNGPSGGGSGGGGGGAGGSSYSGAAEAMGISTADLVRHIRTNEAAEAGDEMLEGIAGVLAVLARMDSLL